jgi:hypothetical protein
VAFTHQRSYRFCSCPSLAEASMIVLRGYLVLAGGLVLVRIIMLAMIN